MIDITYDGEIIFLISFGLSAMSMLVRRVVLDQQKVREHKEKIKTHQDLLKEAQKKKDLKAMQKHQEELFAVMGDQMKQNFKPMIYTTIPFLLVFGWLRDSYNGVGAVASLFGFDFGWFGWYFISSMIISLVLNGIFKVS